MLTNYELPSNLELVDNVEVLTSDEPLDDTYEQANQWRKVESIDTQQGSKFTEPRAQDKFLSSSAHSKGLGMLINEVGANQERFSKNA